MGNSNKKNAKKLRQAARSMEKTEAQRKEAIKNKEAENRMILEKPDMVSSKKVAILWPNALPVLPDDNSDKMVNDTRKTVCLLFSDVLIEMAKLNNYSESCTLLEYKSHQKMLEKLGGLANLKKECDNIVLNFRNDASWIDRFSAFHQLCSNALAEIKKFDESRKAGAFVENGEDFVKINGHLVQKKALKINISLDFNF